MVPLAAALLVPLGFVAGVVTTLAGQGGGLLLVLALSAVVGPHGALALTTPALLFGNMHRAWLCRRLVAHRTAATLVVGVVPGAYVGGRFAGAAPAWLLSGALVLVTGLAVAKAAGWLKADVPTKALAPAGAAIGALAGTSGGAGLLLGPLVHSTGLRGAAFVGTVAAIATALHAARLLAYGSSGMLGPAQVPLAALLAVGIFAGNFAADRLRPRLGDRVTARLELGTLIGCAALALVGVA
ncbi:MAG TPA: TSUP family transporter [Polyangiaceae bacterium]|nr:TSUP family transporter [Polyangiaceae bacterium]